MIVIVIVIMIFVVIMVVGGLLTRRQSPGWPRRVFVRWIRAGAAMPVALKRVLHEARDETAIGTAADAERVVRLHAAHRRAWRFVADTCQRPAGSGGSEAYERVRNMHSPVKVMATP